MRIDQTKLHIPFKERLKSIPEAFGIRMNEEPEYDVIFTDGNFEVRHYYKQLIAKISMHGMSFDDFREAAFKKLAHYIFEGNEQGESIPMTSPVMEQHGNGEKSPGQIAMTSPVLQQQNSNGGWIMSFILPHNYNLQNAPKPTNSEISLEEVQPYIVACLKYKGNNTLEKIKLHERELAEWISKQPNLQSTGKYMVAQYDAPFIIPFMKTNEIQVKVDNLH
ncbi:MAG: heme-binding protein [Bacteriovorax sp.]|nr:heme-binding protein [Bacteriovorax sp.]